MAVAFLTPKLTHHPALSRAELINILAIREADLLALRGQVRELQRVIEDERWDDDDAVPRRVRDQTAVLGRSVDRACKPVTL